MNPSLLTIRHAFLIVGVALSAMLWQNVEAQERPANSYRTDLWNMEFQKQRKQDEPQASTGGGMGFSGVGEGDWGVVPGQTQMTDVTAETPFAEWQIEQSVSSAATHYAVSPSAWMMSRIRAGGSGGEEIPLSNGPSMLTLLVAVIACMVMVGALFADY